MSYPITVSMTPAFYDAEHILLRAQLNCLSKQTVKDFDVWMIDPHYQKRKALIPELAKRFNLDIKHIPYTPNTRVAKYFDCAIFNAAFCYSQSPINVRYSCYRFVRPTFIEKIVNAPPGVNIDFYMNAVGPDLSEKGEPHVKHLSVWNFDSEEVDWSKFPKKSGYDDPGNSLGNWPQFMDCDTETPVTATGNIYGNIAWLRDQWMALNGTNEVITNAAHWEDLDFDTRAETAGQQVVRYSHQLYRLHHHYGSFSQRSNVQVDTPLTRMCQACYEMVFCNSSDLEFGEKLQARKERQDLEIYHLWQAWVCRKCLLSGAIYDGKGLDAYFRRIRLNGITKAPILPKERIGRNLSILADKMDKCSDLKSKVEIYNDSWSNPIFYSA